MASSRERQAKRRAKLRCNREAYETYLEKDRQRKCAQLCAKKALGGAELEAFHLKEKLRIRSRREIKKQQLLQGESSQSQS